MKAFALFRTYLQRWLILWLVALCAIAFQWPTWWQQCGFDTAVLDPFQPPPIVMPVLFTITMLAIGSLLSYSEVQLVYQRWPTVLAGTAIQYSAMPLLAYSLGRLLGMEGPILVGVVMVGCVPGAMASNVLTLMARGNVSYSVSLTTSATLLSPLLVPWILWLLLGRMVTDFPAVRVCVDLCWMVVAPVMVGYFLSHRFAIWARGAQQFAAVIANLTILWIIAVVVGLNRDRLSQLDARLIAVLFLINVGGYLCGNLGARAIRLPVAMRRALTLEVGMQNAGLGSTLALMLFDDSAVALAPAAYTFGCMLTGTLLARMWARWTASDNEMCDASD